MSMEDKSMFSSGLNLTKSGIDSMMDAGLMKEVTQQGDGSEWMMDKEGWGTGSLRFHAQGQGGRLSPSKSLWSKEWRRKGRFDALSGY
mmetsp:Transcript_24731/g.60765  ORF Transcript_24731/g.60765 Transcript_24731/m.60765 type:complete len:88 (-) Transcript_24731:283-546(-)